MGAKGCDGSTGSAVPSADQAWCKTHYDTKDVCETNEECEWQTDVLQSESAVEADMAEDKSIWQKTKNWASNNRVIAGAAAGGAIGFGVGGIGAVPGIFIGAGVGYFSSKEAQKNKVQGLYSGMSQSPTRALDVAVALCMAIASVGLAWIAFVFVTE